MPHTLLLADDSVTIQRVIELTFADEDVKVVAVSDGDQAIERLESAPPDIVLADIGMPGKNGYEVARYIKQSPKLSHIPVVLLTGAFEPVDQARANEAGCDGVLAKPFEPQLVIGRVKDLLAKSHHAPAPAAIDDRLAPPPHAANEWTAKPAMDQAFAEKPASDAAPPLDDYFDRLDAAFQTLSGPPPATSAPQPADAPAQPMPDIDWFGANPNSSAPASQPWDLPTVDLAAPPSTHAPDLPLTHASPESALEAPPSPSHVPEPAVAQAHAPAVPLPAPPEPASVPPPPPAPKAEAAAAPPALPKIAALPPLADAFAALLAAEQGDPAPAAIPAWPATSPSSDELVERVARRVLDRLSDRVVRDTVSELVSQIAEKLVREEIERIKSSIK